MIVRKFDYKQHYEFLEYQSSKNKLRSELQLLLNDYISKGKKIKQIPRGFMIVSKTCLNIRANPKEKETAVQKIILKKRSHACQE